MIASTAFLAGSIPLSLAARNLMKKDRKQRIDDPHRKFKKKISKMTKEQKKEFQRRMSEFKNASKGIEENFRKLALIELGDYMVKILTREIRLRTVFKKILIKEIKGIPKRKESYLLDAMKNVDRQRESKKYKEELLQQIKEQLEEKEMKEASWLKRMLKAREKDQETQKGVAVIAKKQEEIDAKKQEKMEKSKRPSLIRGGRRARRRAASIAIPFAIGLSNLVSTYFLRGLVNHLEKSRFGFQPDDAENFLKKLIPKNVGNPNNIYNFLMDHHRTLGQTMAVLQNQRVEIITLIEDVKTIGKQ